MINYVIFLTKCKYLHVYYEEETGLYKKGKKI